MSLYLASTTIKGAVERLLSAGASSNLLHYLILRRLMVTNTEKDTGAIVLTGGKCKSVINEAAFIGHGDERYFNPIDSNGTFLTNRWWSNGPTDNIKNWGSRSSLLERVQGAKMVTIRVADYDATEVQRFLQIRDNNRISEIDIAIWWFRDDNIESITDNGALDSKTLCEEFREKLQLSVQECADLFTPYGSGEMPVLETCSEAADPREYLPYPDSDQSLNTNEVLEISYPTYVSEPHNLIFFGAPGTGKSHQLKELAKHNFPKENIRRVTFHPDYTYAQFVGCFKPFSRPKLDPGAPVSAIKDAEMTIEYRYVPGPFTNTYVDAIKHPDSNYLLIIEEINRANPAATFGDIFQLLDRTDDGASEYEINVSEDLHDHLKVQIGPFLTDEFGNRFGATTPINDPQLVAATSTIALPNNMYIWATMNSADQGVFPMDAAFKRRWDFRYMDINEGEGEIADYKVPMGINEDGMPVYRVVWNDLRKGINDVLCRHNVNEDKLLGPFFIAPSRLANEAGFPEVFKAKVLLYLYEDAAKMKHSRLFTLGDHPSYAELCKAYDEIGETIFKDFAPIKHWPIDDELSGDSSTDEESGA